MQIKKVAKRAIILFIALFLMFIFSINVNYFYSKLFSQVKIDISIKDNADRVFVVNLDRAPQRWQNTKEVLLQAGFKAGQIERFSATDGVRENVKIDNYVDKTAFTFEDLRSGKVKFEPGKKYKIHCSQEVSFDYTYAYDFFDKFKYRPPAQPLNTREIGCTCSHLRILNEAKKRNYNNILVFEDDVLMTNYLKNNKDALLVKNIPNDFEMLYLGVQKYHYFNIYYNKLLKIKNFFKLDKPESGVNNFYNHYDYFHGTYAMFFSKKGIEKILNNINFRNFGTDTLFSAILEKSKKTYYTNPTIFFPSINKTTAHDANGDILSKIYIIDSEENQQNLQNIISSIKTSREFKDKYEVIKLPKKEDIQISHIENPNAILPLNAWLQKKQTYLIKLKDNIINFRPKKNTQITDFKDLRYIFANIIIAKKYTSTKSLSLKVLIMHDDAPFVDLNVDYMLNIQMFLIEKRKHLIASKQYPLRYEEQVAKCDRINVNKFKDLNLYFLNSREVQRLVAPELRILNLTQFVLPSKMACFQS